MTSTITTLTSHLNTLLEQQASIIRQAEAFAEDLERFETPLKELKKIAAEWNVTPANKTKKASYIASLQIAHEEKNGIDEVNEQIEKITFQIKCAEAQECANATQKVIRVIRTIENEWWVGTEETFHTIYPNEGYEIHYTAHPEKPDTCSLTSNPAILTQNIKINGTMYTVYGCDKEELAQETLVLTDAVHQANPLQGVTSFLEALAIFSAHDVLPFDVIGDIELYEQLKSKWDAMNGDALCRCDWCDAEPLQYQEEVQFAEGEEDVQVLLEEYRKIAPSKSYVTREIEIENILTKLGYKIEWQKEKKQYILQHTEHLQEQLPSVEIRKDGTVGISTEHARLTISAREAYALLSELYDKRDEIYKAAQQNESEPAQKTSIRDKGKEPDEYWAGDTIGKTCDVEGCNNPAKITKHHSKTDEKVRLCHEHRDLDPDTVKQQPDTERRQYAEKHLSEHIKEAGIILYTIITDHLDPFVRMGFPVLYLLPDETSPALFHSSNPSEASQQFRTSYPNAKCISLDEMDEECKKREKAYWEKRHLLGTGLLSWPREERITGRYGLVALFDEDWDQSPWQTDITSLAGKHGSLVAVLDGEEIELGKGIFSIEDIEEIYCVGLIPDEDREEEWLSPTQLHKVDGRVINKPVELWFVEQ